MNYQATIALLVSLFSLASTIVGFFVGIFKWLSFTREQREKLVTMAREQGEREGALKVKIDELWEVYRLGAQAEARRLSVVRSRSPDQLNPDVAMALRENGLGDKLVKFYRDQGLAGLGESQVIIALARAFSDDLATLDMPFQAAIWAALQFCREETANG